MTYERELRVALGVALVGHGAVLGAAASGALARGTAAVIAIACTALAIAALMQRERKALIVAHVVAAAAVASAIVPGAPWPLALAGLAAATAISGAALLVRGGPAAAGAAQVVRAPAVQGPARMAARVAAVALIAHAFLRAWIASGPSAPLRTVGLLVLASLAIAALASLAIVALRAGVPALAGLLAWGLGWVAATVDVGALISWSLGAPFPVGLHQLGALEPAVVEIVATAGGLAIGAAALRAIRDVRTRHSAVVLLAGYVVLGVVVAISEHRLGLATDFRGITALRRAQHLPDELRACALAGVLWQSSRAARA